MKPSPEDSFQPLCVTGPYVFQNCDLTPLFTTRPLNPNSNTRNFGRDTTGTTNAHSQTLVVDDYKIMKLLQDASDRSRFEYVLHLLPDMVGKVNPQQALNEEHYEDNMDRAEKK